MSIQRGPAGGSGGALARSFARDPSVKGRKLSPGIWRRIAGTARPYRRMLLVFLVLIIVPVLQKEFIQARDKLPGLLERPGIGLFGERAQIARADGKIEGGHNKRVSKAAETSASASKCKTMAGLSSFRGDMKHRTRNLEIPHVQQHI